MTLSAEQVARITERVDDTRTKTLMSLAHQHGRILRDCGVRLTLEQSTRVAEHLDKVYTTAVTDMMALLDDFADV